MMRNLLGILLILFAMTSLGAQQFGYVDREALLAEMPEIVHANSDLAALKDELQGKGKSKLAGLQEEYDRLKKTKESESLSPAEKEKLIADLKAKEKELRLFENKMEFQLKHTESMLRLALVNKISDAIALVAKENRLQFIFDQSTQMILFAKESMDVTSLVKKKLGM